MSSFPMPKQGYLYAVCDGQNEAATKIGCTTDHCPQKYLIKHYARTMPVLRTRQLLHVPDVFLAERMVFAALQDHRVLSNHEIFNVEDEIVKQAFQAVRKCFEALGECDESLKPTDIRPTTVEEHVEMKKAAKIAAREARTKRKRQMQTMARKARVRIICQPVKNDITSDVSSFIITRCTTGPQDCVKTDVFRSHFEQHINKHVSHKALSKAVQLLGYAKTQIMVSKTRLYVFNGLHIKNV